MAEHTPGPWIVATEAEVDGEKMPDGSGGMSYTGRDIYDRRLGVVTRADWESDHEPESLARPYLEADAYLIAAAPEMLAALHHAYAALQCVRENNVDHSGAVGPEVIGQVKAAIAKATPNAEERL